MRKRIDLCRRSAGDRRLLRQQAVLAVVRDRYFQALMQIDAPPVA